MLTGGNLARSAWMADWFFIWEMNMEKKDSSELVRDPSEDVVAIIGGGSVATSVLAQLPEQVRIAEGGGHLRRVVIFEPHQTPGAGAAYQWDSASNLLNTRVGSMSPMAADPLHFHRWLQENEGDWHALFPDVTPHRDAFVPRPLFGRYLEHVFQEAVLELQALGISVELIHQKAVSMRTTTGGYEIFGASGARVLARQVVLALGNLETNEWEHLHHYPNFFNTPYPCTKLVQKVHPKRAVCILGTSLSAIDAALSLADAGHAGKIIMVSRNGRLPSVRGEQNLARRPSLLTRERMQAVLDERGAGSMSLAEVWGLLFQEVQLCEGKTPCLKTIMREGQGPHRYLDAEVSDALLHDRAWQAIVYALNDSIDLIWHLLMVEEKRLFQTSIKSLWHSYRVSFPIQNAQKLQRLLHSDQLVVYGGYRDAHFDEAQQRFAVNVCNPAKDFDAIIYADALVNATGYTTDMYKARSPLIRGMIAAGLARPHEFGGVDVDFDTGQILSRRGVKMEGCYALGSLAAGTYFWTNAMNVNTRLAAGVARQLVHVPSASQTMTPSVHASGMAA